LKRLYEGMFVFPKVLNEEEWDAAIGVIQQVVEDAGGEVKSTTRLGKRSFARLIKGQDAGLFVVMRFEIEGGQIAHLHNRFKLNDQLIRVQIVLAEKDVPPPAPETEEDNDDG